MDRWGPHRALLTPSLWKWALLRPPVCPLASLEALLCGHQLSLFRAKSLKDLSPDSLTP